ARRIAAEGKVNVREAERALAALRRESARPSAPIASVRRLPARPPTPPSPAWAAAPEAARDDEAAHERPRPERGLRGKVLVTGAAGHLGANLVRHLLLEEGVEVRVLLRKGSDNSAMDGLDVERVYGDLRDP